MDEQQRDAIQAAWGQCLSAAGCKDGDKGVQEFVRRIEGVHPDEWGAVGGSPLVERYRELCTAVVQVALDERMPGMVMGDGWHGVRGLIAPAAVVAIAQGAAHPGMLLRAPVQVMGRDDWHGIEHEQQWLVDNWIPMGHVTLLAGKGGYGKSWLAMQLALAVASDDEGKGQYWLGDREPTPDTCGRIVTNGAVMYACWEDGVPKVAGKLRALMDGGQELGAQQVNLKYEVLVPENRGEGSLWTMYRDDATGLMRGRLSAAGEYLRAVCEREQVRLLVLDPLAMIWQGNENDRQQVSEFLGSWDAWAGETGTAVVIVSHPAKMASSGEYSGSSQWQGQVRALWTLDKQPLDKPGKDKAPPEQGYILRCTKNNCSARWPGAMWLTREGVRWGHSLDWREISTTAAGSNGDTAGQVAAAQDRIARG